MSYNIEILEQKGYQFLWINDVLWMWDLPIEHRIQKEIANQASGSVLVVGYGLGIVQKYLKENVNVGFVNTVEKYWDVVDKVWKIYGEIYGSIVYRDFYNIIPTPYTYIIGDIWPEIDKLYLPEYKKFKEHAKKFVADENHILGWGKDYFEFLIEKEDKK